MIHVFTCASVLNLVLPVSVEGKILCDHSVARCCPAASSPLLQLPGSQLPRSTPQVGPGSKHKHPVQDLRRSLYYKACVIEPQEGSSAAD